MKNNNPHCPSLFPLSPPSSPLLPFSYLCLPLLPDSRFTELSHSTDSSPSFQSAFSRKEWQCFPLYLVAPLFPCLPACWVRPTCAMRKGDFEMRDRLTNFVVLRLLLFAMVVQYVIREAKVKRRKIFFIRGRTLLPSFFHRWQSTFGAYFSFHSPLFLFLSLFFLFVILFAAPIDDSYRRHQRGVLCLFSIFFCLLLDILFLNRPTMIY